jgi:transcriptional regulator with XRE-family HTH domain
MEPTAMSKAFGAICRARRIELDVTQAMAGGAAGLSRSRYAEIESGRANPTAQMMDRLAEALGIRLILSSASVVVAVSIRPRDAVHSRCMSAVARRLRAAGWLVLREVELQDGRRHGWADLVAFDPVTGTLLVIEIKTSIDDVGRLERQVGWYERAILQAIPPDWQPTQVCSWVLALASEEVDAALTSHRDAFADAFPGRAVEMRAVVDRTAEGPPRRGIALIDPRSRRREWLIAARVDGRRTLAPYRDRASAERSMGGD